MLSVGYYINSRVVNSINPYLPIFSGICQYLPVNTAGMGNAHICRLLPTLSALFVIKNVNLNQQPGLSNLNG